MPSHGEGLGRYSDLRDDQCIIQTAQATTVPDHLQPEPQTKWAWYGPAWWRWTAPVDGVLQFESHLASHEMSHSEVILLNESTGEALDRPETRRSGVKVSEGESYLAKVVSPHIGSVRCDLNSALKSFLSICGWNVRIFPLVSDRRGTILQGTGSATSLSSRLSWTRIVMLVMSLVYAMRSSRTIWS
ncbi:MAG: hypothetical protein ACI9R3_000565 [Verrucomicrobiales bacterium]